MGKGVEITNIAFEKYSDDKKRMFWVYEDEVKMILNVSKTFFKDFLLKQTSTEVDIISKKMPEQQYPCDEGPRALVPLIIILIH